MKCKYKHYNKKCETCGIKLKDCECFLEYIKFKDNLIKYKCLCCNKHHQKNLMRTWRKDSLMHTIFQPMISISLFYCCEKAFALIIIWMIWKIFNKTLLPEKVDIHSHLKMEHITYVDNMHRKWVCKDSKIKNISKYHDLYVQSSLLLLDDVFKNFRNMCLEIHEPDPALFLTAAKSAWQTLSKKTKVKLNLSTDIAILLMVQKGMRGGTYYVIPLYAKANSKYMKDYDKNKESSYLTLGCK